MADSKRKQAFREKVEAGKAYDISEALGLVKEFATAKFPESIDVSVNLGVDPRKSDQVVRGSTVLPNGTGKSVRVAVFAQGDNAEKAKAAGADIVGFEDLAGMRLQNSLSSGGGLREFRADALLFALGQPVHVGGAQPCITVLSEPQLTIRT